MKSPASASRNVESIASSCNVFSLYVGLPNSGIFKRAYLENLNFFKELLNVRERSSDAEENV